MHIKSTNLTNAQFIKSQTLAQKKVFFIRNWNDYFYLNHLPIFLLKMTWWQIQVFLSDDDNYFFRHVKFFIQIIQRNIPPNFQSFFIWKEIPPYNKIYQLVFHTLWSQYMKASFQGLLTKKLPKKKINQPFRVFHSIWLFLGKMFHDKFNLFLSSFLILAKGKNIIVKAEIYFWQETIDQIEKNDYQRDTEEIEKNILRNRNIQRFSLNFRLFQDIMDSNAFCMMQFF